MIDASAVADRSRTDVAAVHRVDPHHGFAISTKPGTVCLYAINRPSGSNPLLGCRVVGMHSAIGALDVVERAPAGVRVAGWSFDPDQPQAPVDVHVYVDGRLVHGMVADGSRTDVARVFPAAGARHGYDVIVPADARARSVCAYGVNRGPGPNVLLGCRAI